MRSTAGATCEITPDAAFEAFQEATRRNDHNAMINLYRDYLGNSDYAETINERILEQFSEAIARHDATAIFDLYKHFLKNSPEEGPRALERLYQRIKDNTIRAETWGVIAFVL